MTNKAEDHATANKPTSPGQKPARSRKSKKPASPMKQNCWDVFLRFAWGKSDEATALLERYRADVSESSENLEQLDLAERDGRHAQRMGARLRVRIKQNMPDEEIEAWIRSVVNNVPSRVAKHLKLEWQKHCESKSLRNRRRGAAREFRPSLPYVELAGNAHSQSLRSLQPSHDWTVLIDETGEVFDFKARSLSERNRRLGRAVALALPAGVKLPPAPEGFHATSATDQEVEALVGHLLAEPVGILGGSFGEDLSAGNWLDGIRHLIFWVVLMLPVQDKTRVRVLVENRGEYKSSGGQRNLLEAVADIVRSRLTRVAPDRAERINLSVEVMNKHHPHNGYVDTIANLWGSPALNRKSILARTSWLGHCLFQNVKMGQVERLYLGLGQAIDDPDPADWFELCHMSAREPQHSLLPDLARRIGERARQQPGLWQACLNEVQRRIHIKHYTPRRMMKALQWLEEYRPNDATLPGALALQLNSTRLAAGNHLGHSDPSRVVEVLKQAGALKDEAPQEACEAVLRVAISATHTFEFSVVRPFIEQWLAEPVAVPGLLNHGKLHSTLGQLDAFTGDYQSALQSFDTALTCFRRLSDPQLAAREAQQTGLYRSLVALDAGEPDAVDDALAFLQQATNRKRKTLASALARSGEQWRFFHHFLLRLLVAHPELDGLHREYLAAEDQWQSGEDHPWMLIEAYRGWLLQRAGQSEAAAETFASAIEGCFEDEDSVILHWMGYVLKALAESLQLSLGQITTRPLPAPGLFPDDALEDLAVASTDQGRLEMMAKALPFNFR